MTLALTRWVQDMSDLGGAKGGSSMTGTGGLEVLEEEVFTNEFT